MEVEKHPMEHLSTREFYERYEDMSPDVKLQIVIEDDGDVIVSIYQPRGEGHEDSMASSQFCTYTGGGRSLKVRDAILRLAVAIKEENAANPQHRESPNAQ